MAESGICAFFQQSLFRYNLFFVESLILRRQRRNVEWNAKSVAKRYFCHVSTMFQQNLIFLNVKHNKRQRQRELERVEQEIEAARIARQKAREERLKAEQTMK